MIILVGSCRTPSDHYCIANRAVACIPYKRDIRKRWAFRPNCWHLAWHLGWSGKNKKSKKYNFGKIRKGLNQKILNFVHVIGSYWKNGIFYCKKRKNCSIIHWTTAIFLKFGQKLRGFWELEQQRKEQRCNWGVDGGGGVGPPPERVSGVWGGATIYFGLILYLFWPYFLKIPYNLWNMAGKSPNLA